MSKHNENNTIAESATAEALSLLVINLNRFNTAFAENTRRLDQAIDKLSVQMEDGQRVSNTLTLPSEAEIKRVASAQIDTLQKMQQLMDGYMSEMTRTASVSDAALRSALTNLKEATSENINRLNALFVEQSDQFKRVLNDERESFESINAEITSCFNERLERIPQLAERLQQLAGIPERLDLLIEKIIESQTVAMVNVNRTVRQALADATTTRRNTITRSNTTINTILLFISTICLLALTFKFIF